MKKTILLFLVGVIIGSLLTSVIIIRYQLPTRIANLINRKPEPSQVSSPSPMPSPSPTPTEKSLRLAAFAWARLTQTQMKELKQIYNAQNSTDAQFLNIWALDMDNDPALYAKNEAIMEKTLSIENRSTSNTQTQNIGEQIPLSELYIK